MHCRQTFQQYWKVFCLESWCLRTKSDGILFPGRALLLLLYPYIQDGNFSYAPLASSLILMVHMVLQYPPGINKGGGSFISLTDMWISLIVIIPSCTMKVGIKIDRIIIKTMKFTREQKSKGPINKFTLTTQILDLIKSSTVINLSQRDLSVEEIEHSL